MSSGFSAKPHIHLYAPTQLQLMSPRYKILLTFFRIAAAVTAKQIVLHLPAVILFGYK